MCIRDRYEYDAVSRLRDSQIGGKDVSNIKSYIKKGKIWNAFESAEKTVLLIDEIDKADIEFPNDLLQELDKMEFFVYETGEVIKSKNRPIVIITSNNEKELPDAFLRRCFFHFIQFPDQVTLTKIIKVHFPHIKKTLLDRALQRFFEIRDSDDSIFTCSHCGRILYYKETELEEASLRVQDEVQK